MIKLSQKRIRCLLIHPKFSPYSFWNFVEVSKIVGAKYQAAPLGLMTVAALLPQDWEIKLIDADTIIYSNPPERNLRLSLKNEELCDAVISKEITFDVSLLKLATNKIKLNILNSGDQILYIY